MTYFSPFWLDTETRQLRRDSTHIVLSPKAAVILAALVARRGTLLSKEELLDEVWPDGSVQPSILKVYIRELRKALSDSAQRPRYIETLAGRGYRFIADVADAFVAEASSTFAGRGRELAVLKDALQRARAGRRQAVFVTGRSGIGKTALCDVFLAGLGPSDTLTARGQCFEASAPAEPYYAVLDALTHVCRDDELIAGEVITHAPGWFAELPQYGRADHPRPTGAIRSNARLTGEMRELIRAVTGTRALVLVLEDLHWADAATLELIARIMRSGDPGALLILGTFRSGTFATSEAVVERLARFQSARDATLLTLTELTEEDVSQCLDLRFRSRVTTGLAPVLYGATSGHPQYMSAALDELVTAGLVRQQNGRWTLSGTAARVHRSIDETVQRVIARRLGRLPPRARMLLGTAAHIGTQFDAHVAGTVADVDVWAVEQECDRLVGEGFLERDHHKELPDGTHAAGYRFRRDVERAALQHQTLPAAAARLKQRVASALALAI